MQILSLYTLLNNIAILFLNLYKLQIRCVLDLKSVLTSPLIELVLKSTVPHLRSLQADPDLVSPALRSTTPLNTDDPSRGLGSVSEALPGMAVATIRRQVSVLAQKVKLEKRSSIPVPMSCLHLLCQCLWRCSDLSSSILVPCGRKQLQ